MKLGRRRGNDFCIPDQYGFLISWRRCQIVAMFFSIFPMFVFSDIQGSYMTNLVTADRLEPKKKQPKRSYGRQETAANRPDAKCYLLLACSQAAASSRSPRPGRDIPFPFYVVEHVRHRDEREVQRGPALARCEHSGGFRTAKQPKPNLRGRRKLGDSHPYM